MHDRFLVQDLKNLKVTTPPPDFEEILSVEEPEHASGGIIVELKAGLLVEGLFSVTDDDDDHDEPVVIDQWFRGQVTESHGDHGWAVLYEDAETLHYKKFSDIFRPAPGPWENWFDTHLEDLVHSAVLSLRMANQRTTELLEPVLKPENYRRMARPEDVLSSAGTPAAETKRKRSDGTGI